MGEALSPPTAGEKEKEILGLEEGIERRVLVAKKGAGGIIQVLHVGKGSGEEVGSRCLDVQKAGSRAREGEMGRRKVVCSDRGRPGLHAERKTEGWEIARTPRRPSRGFRGKKRVARGTEYKERWDPTTWARVMRTQTAGRMPPLGGRGVGGAPAPVCGAGGRSGGWRDLKFWGRRSLAGSPRPFKGPAPERERVGVETRKEDRGQLPLQASCTRATRT